VEMEVNGLVCAFCAQGIQKAIRQLSAAQDVFVNLEHRIVAVQLRDGQDIPDDTLRAAVTDAGYSTVRIERSDATLDAIRARVAAQERSGD
jgi:copper chaperone CopZ